ncbi:MAG: hypothetical protein PVI71_05395 [Desulfobacterales bacterium]
MKELLKLSMLLVVLAFLTHPCTAGNIIYFAPDGSQISKAEYDRLVAGQAERNKNLKKARSSKPAKKSRQLISATQPKAAPIKSSSTKSAVVAGVKTSKISESHIRQIVKDVIHSTNNREADKLLQYLAPSYKGTLKTEDEQMSLNREEYKDYLEEGWGGYGFYRARHENEKIKIGPNKQKATLETDLIEIASLTDGFTLKLRSHQKWIFEIIDGKILITSSEAQVKEL